MKKLLGLCLLGLSVFASGCVDLDVDREGLIDFTAFDYEQKITVSSGILVNEGKLTVGTSPDYAPFSFLDAELKGLSKIQGSESAMAMFLSQTLGLELVFEEVAFDGLTGALDNGSIDIILSGLTYKESREEYYSFTDTYYSSGDGGQVLIAKKDSVANYTTVADINKASVTIAAQNASLQYELVETQLEDANIQTIAAIADGVTLLKNGNVEFLASSLTSAEAIVASNDDLVIVEVFEFEVSDEGTMGLLKKNSPLLTFINQAIALFDNATYATWLEEYSEYVDAIAF